jgi:hypothetical protein
VQDVKSAETKARKPDLTFKIIDVLLDKIYAEVAVVNAGDGLV